MSLSIERVTIDGHRDDIEDIVPQVVLERPDGDPRIVPKTEDVYVTVRDSVVSITAHIALEDLYKAVVILFSESEIIGPPS